jgi:putative oxidoreductase
MTIVRRIARPLLAAPLIQSGIETARHPGPQAELARPLIQQVQQPLRLPADEVVVVRIAGLLTAGAGTLLALGKLPRLSALTLVLTAPVVQSNQPFWKEKDAHLRAVQRNEFLKNLGLLGGTLLAAVDTQGRPSLAYRGRRAGRLAGHRVSDAVHDAGDSAVHSFHAAHDSAIDSTRKARKSAAKAQKKAVKRIDKRARKAQKQAAEAAGRARRSLPV